MTEGPMSSSQIFQLVIGVALGLGLLPMLRFLVRCFSLEVEDETALLVTKFGRLIKTIKTPGFHWFFHRPLPWVQVIPVSMQRDFRHFEGIHVNDCRGTTVVIDLWIEFRVADPERALFQVENWELSLQSVLIHSATSILGAKEFKQILTDRDELGRLLLQDIAPETSRWGLGIETVFIRKVSLLPEVSRRMFDTVAAHLERAKADVEEEGRLQVAMLEADTSARVASLVGEAKGQYPAAVGRAFHELRKNPEVLAGYTELYELSLVRPHRTVAFQGFAENEVRAMDAAMVAPPMTEFVPPPGHGMQPLIAPLSSSSDRSRNPGQ